MITIRTSFRHEIILTRRLSLLAVPFRLPGRICRRSLLRLVLTHEGGHSFIGESFSSVSAGLARLGKGHGGGLASTADPHRGRRLLCPWRRRLCRRRAVRRVRLCCRGLNPGKGEAGRNKRAWAIGGRGLTLSNPPSGMYYTYAQRGPGLRGLLEQQAYLWWTVGLALSLPNPAPGSTAQGQEARVTSLPAVSQRLEHARGVVDRHRLRFGRMARGEGTLQDRGFVRILWGRGLLPRAHLLDHLLTCRRLGKGHCRLLRGACDDP